jgi:hypothetical protein
LFDPKTRPWILDVVRYYSEWTTNANGAGLAINDDVMGKPREWNDAYFDALANCLSVLAPTDVDKLALDPIRSLPEESFLDTMATFIRDVDGVFFNDGGLSAEAAVRIRSALAERLKETSRWRTWCGAHRPRLKCTSAPQPAPCSSTARALVNRRPPICIRKASTDWGHSCRCLNRSLAMHPPRLSPS